MGSKKGWFQDGRMNGWMDNALVEWVEDTQDRWMLDG